MSQEYRVTHDPDEIDKVRKLMSDVDIAMVTTIDSHADGVQQLVSRPLSTQAAEDGDAVFLVQRTSHVAEDVLAHPQVNVAYSSKKAWVSVAGSADIIDDPALVKRYWSRGAAAFMDGGPENPQNVILKVHGDTAVYWGGESLIGTVVQTAKAVLGNADDQPQTVVDLD